MLRKEASLSILTIVIMLVASMATLTQFGTFGNAQGQGNLTQKYGNRKRDVNTRTKRCNM
jgi:hypothetical protein